MTLRQTRDEVRTRQTEQVGTVGRPNAWWAWDGGSDCMAAQAYLLGLRVNPADRTPHLISIAAFLDHYGWDRPDISDLQAGDLVVENWTGADGGKMPEHIEYVYAIDRAAGLITTCSANTGPRPGINTPTGFWKKTRPISTHFLHGVRPPYAGAVDTSPYGAKAPTGVGKKDVKAVAAFLNHWIDVQTPDGTLHTKSTQDGVAGPNYWTLVQSWGRRNGVYGSTFHIDGIPGPRTRQVEAIIVKRIRTAAKK